MCHTCHGGTSQLELMSGGNTFFSNLTFDVLVQIFILSTPQDVLSVRMVRGFLSIYHTIMIIIKCQCCKTLCAVTRHRHVWLQLLRRFCFIYRLFPPTFPFNKMTTSELEHAVTSPYQFTAILRRAANALDACNKLSPRVTRILYCNPPGSPHPLPDISAIYLVPGGRFLLTSSTDFVMSLWDLGYNSNISIDHSPVASVVFQHIVSEFEVQATADDMGIRICIVAPSLLSPPSTLVKVLEIFPSSPLASFSQIAEFSLPHLLLSYSFNNDLIAYNYGDYIGVRNFVSNMAVVWYIVDVSGCDVCDARRF
jgi:hypothetical protein